MWHVLTSSKCTWSRKQIVEVERDTQERLSHSNRHRLTHICCQIPSLSPGLSYDQQCYQWFTGKLNCLMENLPIQFCWWKQWGYSFNCEMAVEWQICVQPRLHFSHPDVCEKVKKAHYWKTEPLCKFEFGGGETVIKTAEAKNKIMIPFHGSRDMTSCEAQLHQVVWKITQHTQNYGAVWM